MSHRQLFALIVAVCTVSQVGCVCMRNFGCGGCGGMGGQVYNDCCPSCGVADSCCDCASCGVADVSCGCPDPCCGPDASCGCPDGCCDGVGCGSGVRPRCRLLARLRDCLCGCSSGCGCQTYWSEWQDCPPCDCDPCDCYGNYIGGPYGSQHGRRARMAKRNISDELRFAEEDVETTYR